MGKRVWNPAIQYFFGGFFMLKMTDTGLMAEHLMMHDGVMHRLMDMKAHVQNDKLRKTVSQQIEFLKEHSITMSNLLGSENSLTFSEESNHQDQHSSAFLQDKHIAIDGMFTANALAKENFSHSTVMKNEEVKEQHMKMAMDQMNMASEYESIIKENGWSIQPSASEKQSSEVVQEFKELTANQNN